MAHASHAFAQQLEMLDLRVDVLTEREARIDHVHVAALSAIH